MRCHVHLLCHPGRRLPWREISNGPSFEDNFGTHYLSLRDGRYFVAALCASGDARCTPILPVLYEPVLTGIVQGRVLLRGFERIDESAVVQEWRCKLLGA